MILVVDQKDAGAAEIAGREKPAHGAKGKVESDGAAELVVLVIDRLADGG